MLLHRQGVAVSTSMVGRVLRRLKQRGTLIEPLRIAVSARNGLRCRPWAMRKPKDYLPRALADLVEVDTLDLRPLPGLVLKHFTARDVISRWDVVEVHNRATANTATAFLDAICARMPFTIRALQVDGGSEFEADFEHECRRRQLRLFVLPPRSPKLNGAVERAQRTHTEEFYEVWPLSNWNIDSLNRETRAWERIIYNTVRLH